MTICFNAECGDPFNVFHHAGFLAEQAFCVFQGFPSSQWINVIFQILQRFLLMEKTASRKYKFVFTLRNTGCRQNLLSSFWTQINTVVLLTSAKLSCFMLTGWLMLCFCFRLFWVLLPLPCEKKIKYLQNTHRFWHIFILICKHFYLSLKVAFITAYGNLNEIVCFFHLSYPMICLSMFILITSLVEFIKTFWLILLHWLVRNTDLEEM